ncbi:unnamed protein product [Ixodes pacificus]
MDSSHCQNVLDERKRAGAIRYFGAAGGNAIPSLYGRGDIPARTTDFENLTFASFVSSRFERFARLSAMFVAQSRRRRRRLRLLFSCPTSFAFLSSSLPVLYEATATNVREGEAGKLKGLPAYFCFLSCYATLADRSANLSVRTQKHEHLHKHTH